MKKHTDFREYLLEKLKDSDHAAGFVEICLEEYEEDHDVASLLHGLEYVAEARGCIEKLPARGEELCALVSSALTPMKEIDKLLHLMGFHRGIRKWEPTQQEQATGTG